MMHKVLNNKAPECLTETFAPLKDGSIYNLKGSDHYVARPKPSTEYLKKSFLYHGAKLWNSLPTNLKQSNL